MYGWICVGTAVYAGAHNMCAYPCGGLRLMLGLIPSRSSFSLFFKGIFVWISVLFIWVPHACLAPAGARRGHWVPGTIITDGCEPPYGPWKLNLGPLPEQQVLRALEPSIFPPPLFLLFEVVSKQNPEFTAQLAFMYVLRIWTLVLLLSRQALYPLSHLPPPNLSP